MHEFKRRFPHPPDDWTQHKISEIADRVNQRNTEANQNVLTISAEHGLISQTEYFSRRVASESVTGYFLLESGDFAYNKSYSKGYPLGAIRRLERYAKGCVSPLYICFRPKASVVDSGFLMHYLDGGAIDAGLADVAKEGVRNHGLLNVGVADFFGLDIPLPPIAEQRKVAQVLDTLDTTIRQTEAIIAKLKQVKQGLLHDLLTRGIDGSGELRPPQSEAPHLYKASPLGWIPVAWSVVETAHRCSLITKGTTPASNQMWQGEEGVRFLRVDNLSFDGQLNFNASNFRISTVTHESELMRSQCLPGDVLTNIVGPPLGKLGLITEESGPININQAIALFRPTSYLLSNFLLTWLGSTLSQVWLRQRAKQTSGQVNLTLALCQELPIPDMPLIEQRAIVERIASSQARIDVEASTLHKLAQLKSGLMDDLLTGRVRVTPLLAQVPATKS